MNKLTLLFILFLTNISLATANPYIKLGAGLNSAQPVVISNPNMQGRITPKNKFPVIEIGLGYDFNRMRLDLSYDYYFMFYSKEKFMNRLGDEFFILSNTKINAAMVNFYINIFENKRITPFIGGGLGLSFIDDKKTGYGKNSYEVFFESLNKTRYKYKKLAYKLNAGISYPMYDNCNLDLNYNFMNLGRNKKKLIEGQTDKIVHNYFVHNIIVNFRFSL